MLGPLSFAVVFCFFASLALGDSPASAWFNRVWRIDDGLPNNRVDAIMQGWDGYLWVATAEALVRFDGVRFTKFSAPSSGRNEDWGVDVISPSLAGGLWFAPTHGPILRLNRDFSFRALSNAGLPKGRAAAMLEDAEGSLWIAYENTLYQVASNKTRQFTAKEDLPKGTFSAGSLALDDAGRVWLAKGSRVGFFQNGQFIQLANFYVRKPRLAEARHRGGIWAAAGMHLYRCNAEGGPRDMGAFQPETLHSWARVILEDHTGAVWIGTDNTGLFRYSEAGYEKIETSHPAILSLAEDREGNIWVGTAGGGLDRISRSGVQLEGYDGGSSRVAIQSVCQDTAGLLWGATQDGVLVCRTNGAWSPALTNAHWAVYVTAVAADRTGAVWIGTRDRILYCWRDHQLANWTPTNGLVGHTVVDLLPASDGDLWVAEYGTPNNIVQCLHEGQLRTLTPPGNPASIRRITSLAEDASGRLWVAYVKGVLMRAEGDHLVDVSSLLASHGRSILCLDATPDGALWIGYEGLGLGRLKDGHFARVGTEQGLYDDYISQIMADDQGCFWFGSEHGIFKVDRKELESVLDGRAARLRSIHYARNEGLLSMEANSANIDPFVSPNAFRGGDGRIWIPMRTALAVVDPKILHEDPQPPLVLLTQITMDGQAISSYGKAAQRGGGLALASVPLRLPPGHRHLEFEFTAIHLSAPENVHFRYRLVGFDNDWVETETVRAASYSRLTAGDYRFEVEARTARGPWSTTPASLALAVSPFFWQTWWFQAACAAGLLSAVVLIVRYVSFRRLRHKLLLLEQQTTLDRERSRIAKDLHDDLGGSLTEVGLLVKRLHQHQHDSKKVEFSVRKISSTVRRVNESLDDIVWAINPRNDTLPDLIGHLGQSAVDLLRLAGLKCEVDLPTQFPPCVLTPEQRHNLFLAAKEAVNNVVRHAQASQVRFKIEATEADLKIMVEDNGCGFSGAPERNGSDGLRNMRHRMKEIGGQCRIDAAPGKGTRVSFSFPLPSKNGT